MSLEVEMDGHLCADRYLIRDVVGRGGVAGNVLIGHDDPPRLADFGIARSGRVDPMEGFVLVGGWPGSGKTTLSRALAPVLGMDCLSKDDFKEDLMDQLGAPTTVEQSRELGVSAVLAALEAARKRTGAVIDSTWYPYSLPLVRNLAGPFVEVRCRLDVTLARERYHRRDRDPRHLDGRRTDAELWGSEVAALGVGPLLVVDTTGPVDITALAALVRSSLTA